MKPARPQDALAILAVAAAIGALALVRNVPDWLKVARALPGDLLSLLADHPLVVMVLGLLVAIPVTARMVATRRALRSRRRLVARAAEDFDPSSEAVVRFASSLGRLRRATGGWLDARASALRIRLTATEQGRLRYEIEAPQRSLDLVRQAAAVYDRVQLVEPDKEPPTPIEKARLHRERHVARAELVLARPSSEPLRKLGLEPDPLGGFAAALSALRGDLAEHATVAVDLRSTSAGRRRRLRRRLLNPAATSADRPTAAPLIELLGGGGRAGSQRTPGELVDRRLETRALDEKLGSGEPLLELQILLCAESRSPVRARAHVQALLSCFDAFAAENHLRVAGLRVGPLGFLGSDAPWRRRRFDRRLATGLFRPARRGYVTPAELAGLLKPPTVHCSAVNVERATVVAAPPGLPTFSGQRALIPLGRLEDGGGSRLVGVPVEGTFFSYCAGRSRYGKTETAISQFVHLVRSGHGGLFLDPHQDALTEIAAHLTEPKLADRVVWIDLADPAATERQPAWNPLALRERTAEAATERVDALVDAFASALRWDERNTRALNLTTQAAQALTELALILPAQLCPTLFQIPRLLADEDWRTQILPHVSEPTRRFFEDRFPRLPAEAITPVTNLIDRLRASRAVTCLLGQATSTYDVRAAMDHGKIVLACPGAGGTRDRLVANFLVYDLLHAAKSRASIPPDRRRPFFCFLDEVQTYDGASSGNLAALLEQTAKYGIRAFLFNQSPDRLTDATLGAVTTNRSHLATTALGAKGAALIAREWGGTPDAATIERLAPYTFLAQVTLGRERTPPFLVHGVRARELHADAHHPDRVQALQERIANASPTLAGREVLAALDVHDQAIVDRLQQSRRAGRPPHRQPPSGDGGGQQRERGRRFAPSKLPSTTGGDGE